MADTFTAALNLCKPEINASLETWGIKLNSDLDLIDTHAAAVIQFMAAAENAVNDAINAAVAAAMPSKSIIAWYGQPNAVPAGWLLCNGQNGTPNLSDRFIKGTAGLQAVGSSGGSDGWSVPSSPGGAHDHGGAVNGTAITYDQMPVHKHQGQTDAQGLHSHGVVGGEFVVTQAGGGGGLPGGAGYGVSANTNLAGDHSHNIDTDWQGGGQAHAHGVAFAGDHTHQVSGPMDPPWVALLYIMKE